MERKKIRGKSLVNFRPLKADERQFYGENLPIGFLDEKGSVWYAEGTSGTPTL